MDFFDPFGAFDSTFSMFIGLFGLIFIIGGYFVLKHAKREEEALYKVERLPPLQLEDAVDGIALKTYGKIVCDSPLKTPYAAENAVWSRSLEEEYVETTDSKGRKSGHWRTVADMVNTAPFQIDDGTGKIWVDLRKANREFVDAERIFSWSGFHRRKSEWALKPGYAFVYGFAQQQVEKLTIMKSEREQLIASFREEKEMLKFKRSDDKLFLGFGYLLMIIGVIAEYFAVKAFF
ncbi:MAG: GIDE domain-containing protein [Candidatus Micrarchaeota archaeon]